MRVYEGQCPHSGYYVSVRIHSSVCQCRKSEWGHYVDIKSTEGSYVRVRGHNISIIWVPETTEAIWINVVTLTALSMSGHTVDILRLEEAIWRHYVWAKPQWGHFVVTRVHSECIIWVMQVTVTMLCQCQMSKWVQYVSRGHIVVIIWMSDICWENYVNVRGQTRYYVSDRGDSEWRNLENNISTRLFPKINVSSVWLGRSRGN